MHLHVRYLWLLGEEPMTHLLPMRLPVSMYKCVTTGGSVEGTGLQRDDSSERANAVKDFFSRDKLAPGPCMVLPYGHHFYESDMVRRKSDKIEYVVVVDARSPGLQNY